MKNITVPFKKNDLKALKAGQEVILSGVIYTARDQAHKRLIAMIRAHRKLPFDIGGQVLYYCGPTKTPPHKVIGSCGPTTSRRMDDFAIPLLKKGLCAMIGKGGRSREVCTAIQKHRALYFIAPSGCGALLAQKVLSKKLVAFAELGPEAIYRLEVKDFPLIVGIDTRGKSIYEMR